MRRRLAPILMCVFSLLPVASAAQPVSQERVRDWFEEEFAEAGEADLSPPLRGREFRYRVEWHRAAATPAELDQWRREVQGRPDHPSRQKLEAAERYLREGPQPQEITVWYHSPKRWRYSKSSEAEGWWEIAADGDTAWSWVEEQLRVVGPDPSPDQGNYASGDIFRSDVERLLYAGLDYGQYKGIQLRDLRVSGDRWTAVTALGDGPDLAYEYEGRWDEAAGRGFVERMRTVASREHPEWIGRTWTFSGWRHDPVLDRHMPSRVEEYRPDGRLDKVIEFDRAAPFDTDRLDDLVAVPSLDRPDPIRGPLRVKTIYDFRPDRQVKTALGPAGQAQSTPMPGRAETRWVRYAGWVILALLAAGLVGIRMLQHRRRA